MEKQYRQIEFPGINFNLENLLEFFKLFLVDVAYHFAGNGKKAILGKITNSLLYNPRNGSIWKKSTQKVVADIFEQTTK